MSNVLCIAVHPDDETLGCGGTILRHKALGDSIHWLIITNIFEKDRFKKERVSSRQEEIQKVSQLYAFDSVSKLDLPSTKLDTLALGVPIGEIMKVIEKIRPDTIYLTNKSDVNTDHQITFKAVMAATKNFRVPFIKRMLMYETLSSTEFAPAVSDCAFVPNVFIDITDYFEKKIEIFKIYRSEVMEPGKPRSLETIESLAKYRGSRIGCTYAEAFMLLEEIIS
jgi:LmbE family N-acetylglucosaminyl deacetylase